MTSQEIRASIGKPELLKMQQVAEGLQVGAVLGNRVLVEPVEPRTKMHELEAAGILYTPQKAKEENTPRPSTGIVLKVGNLVSRDGEWAKLQAGAMVMFNKFAPMSFAIEKKTYLMVDVGDIACTLEAVEGKAMGDLVQPIEQKEEADVPVMAGRSMIG